MADNTKDTSPLSSVVDESGKPGLDPAVSTDQLAISSVEADYEDILSGSAYDALVQNYHAADADVPMMGTFRKDALRFDDLLGGTEGRADLEGLLGNPANHSWAAFSHVFTASDDKGTEITLNMAVEPAMLVMTYTYDGKVHDQYMDINKHDIAAHTGEHLDGQSVVHMLQELIKATS